MCDGPPAPWGPCKDYIFQDIIMFLLLLLLTLATAQCQVNDSLNESLIPIVVEPVEEPTPIVIELTESPLPSDSPSTLTPTVPEVIEDIPSTPSLKNETVSTQGPTQDRDDYGLYPFPLVPPTETPTTDAKEKEEVSEDTTKVVPIPIPLRGQEASSTSHATPCFAVILCLLVQIMSFIT